MHIEYNVDAKVHLYLIASCNHVGLAVIPMQSVLGSGLILVDCTPWPGEGDWGGCLFQNGGCLLLMIPPPVCLFSRMFVFETMNQSLLWVRPKECHALQP